MTRTTLLLADDHEIVLTGLRLVLDQLDFEVVGSVMDGRALVRAAEELQPQVIVTDITMPFLNGIDAARQIRQTNPAVKIIFLTMHAEIGIVAAALSLGNCGYVLKSSLVNELPEAIRAVSAGSSWISPAIREPAMRAFRDVPPKQAAGSGNLTARQREVLQLLAEGLTVKEIAWKLHISPKTVEFHKHRIKAYTGLRSLAELVLYAARNGILR